MASMAQDSVGAHPLLERERILSLDMLRGFRRAGPPGDEYPGVLANPMADERMMAIFCLPYGAGMFLLTARIEQRARRRPDISVLRHLAADLRPDARLPVVVGRHPGQLPNLRTAGVHSARSRGTPARDRDPGPWS
jgi:hypothetical protein